MLKEINKLQVVNEKEVFNKVFCSSCVGVLGYTKDESHDIDLLCRNCAE
jgi:hypothetical protein